MLLFRYFQSYHLDFQSISKHNFDIICQQYLPFIPNRIISLRLSDDDETPTLPKLFLSLGFNLNQFIRLKSLTLNHLHSFDTVNQLIISCQSLSYLSLIKCCLHTNDKNIPSLLNHIWQLPKLIHCHLSDIFPVPNLISSIETISPTIRNLSLDAICCDLNDLANLFTCTPNLQRFRTNISPSDSNQQFEMLFPSMISLKIFHLNSISFLMFIQNMPNLRSLTIESTNLYLNGYKWETIFRDYLPKIKFFRLKMEFIFPYQNLIKQQIHQFLETFQTPFWLEKHQWFVRCYCTIRNGLKIAVLHTLPYLFEDLHSVDEDYSKSTSPNEEDYSSISNNENFSQSHVRSLCIDLPFDDQLCERVSCLYSLKIRGTIDFTTTSFLSKTTLIRRLDFLEHTSHQCYNQEACIILANSLLGCQCEVLSIEVENRTDILYLFKTMSHLRMLIFRCEYDRWMDTDCEIALKNNELFIWLENHFPSTCLFRRDSHLASSYMRLWIG